MVTVMDSDEKKARPSDIMSTSRISGPLSPTGTVPMSEHELDDEPPPYTPTATVYSPSVAAPPPPFDQLQTSQPMTLAEKAGPEPPISPAARDPAGSAPSQVAMKKCGDIKSGASLVLEGPMQVDGYVKSNGNIQLLGDFEIKDKVETYGKLDIEGNVRVKDKIKSYSNIRVIGKLVTKDKISAYGALKIIGNVECSDKIDVHGAIIIKGTLKCKSLQCYGSVTLIGDSSSYDVAEKRSVSGKEIRKKDDFEGEAKMAGW